MYSCLKSFVVSEVKCQHQLKYDANGKKIVSDGEMQRTRHDTLLVIASGFTTKSKDLGSEVLTERSGLSNVLDT